MKNKKWRAEGVMASFMVLSQHLTGAKEENSEKDIKDSWILNQDSNEC
jgi:hypothetical protein